MMGQPIRGATVDALLRYVVHPGAFERWEELGKQIGWCERPVRLEGWTRRVDVESGVVVSDYSTAVETDGLLLPCRNRRKSRCRPCSTRNQIDNYVLISEGLVGGKRIPRTVSEHPRAWVTLTAPSFGPVHASFSSPGTCAPTQRVCVHGLSLQCAVTHLPEDPLVGAPRCERCYRYTELVLWHVSYPELWRRTTIEVRRRLAALAGISQRAAARLTRVSFVSVSELQQRSAWHRHAIFRLDSWTPPGELPLPPPPPFDHMMLVAAIRQAVERVATPEVRVGGVTHVAKWGSQVHVEPIFKAEDHLAGEEPTPSRISGYLAKYLTKDLPGEGVQGHAGDGVGGRCAHYQRILEECVALSGEPALAGSGLLRHLESFGSAARISTRSRGYSTTMGALRNERRLWVIGGSESDASHGEIEKLSDWRYVGSGWRAGEKEYAQQRAAGRAESRQLARETRRERHPGEEARRGK